VFAILGRTKVMTHTSVTPSRVGVLVVTVTLASVLPSAAVAQNVIGQPFTEQAPALARSGERPATGGTGPTVTALFSDTLRDFQRLPSRETALLLSIGGIAAGVGHTFDRRVTSGLSNSSSFDTMLSAGKQLGGARLQIAGAITTYTVGRIAGESKVATVGADLIRAQIVAQTMTAGVKFAVGRTRPDGTQYSFPSGHSSVTFATATVLQRDLGWKAGIPAYGLATYVAASRIQDKRHFLSDVTFGAAIGLAAGRTVTIGTREAKFAVSPAATPGGAAVQFTWIPKN
jgi:membrane-associated phospholipid phosphatase